MKKLIAILLCLTLISVPAMAQNKAPEDTPHQNMGIAVPLLILTIGITGIIVVIKIASNLPSDRKPTTFVLEKSTDHSNWTPIVTNTVTLNGTNAIEFFREYMTDTTAFYRAKKI